MCSCHLPVLFKTILGYLIVTKEVGIKTREVETLRFIHHLHFSESQFGPLLLLELPNRVVLELGEKERYKGN